METSSPTLLTRYDLWMIRLHLASARMLHCLELLRVGAKTAVRGLLFLSGARDMVRLGEIFEVQGEPRIAVDYYKKALVKSSRYTPVHLGLARCYLRLIDLRKADEHIDKFLKKKPDEAEGLLYKGIILYYTGETQKALDFLSRAERLLPDKHKKTASALEYMGECRKKLGDLAGAVRDFEASIKMNPFTFDPKIFTSLGEACFMSGSKDVAFRHFQKALELNPTNHEAWNNIGVVLFETGQIEKAKACFLKSLELKPGYGEAVFNLKNCENQKDPGRIRPSAK